MRIRHELKLLLLGISILAGCSKSDESTFWLVIQSDSTSAHFVQGTLVEITGDTIYFFTGREKKSFPVIMNHNRMIINTTE